MSSYLFFHLQALCSLFLLPKYLPMQIDLSCHWISYCAWFHGFKTMHAKKVLLVTDNVSSCITSLNVCVPVNAKIGSLNDWKANTPSSLSSTSMVHFCAEGLPTLCQLDWRQYSWSISKSINYCASNEESWLMFLYHAAAKHAFTLYRPDLSSSWKETWSRLNYYSCREPVSSFPSFLWMGLNFTHFYSKCIDRIKVICYWDWKLPGPSHKNYALSDLKHLLLKPKLATSAFVTCFENFANILPTVKQYFILNSFKRRCENRRR